MKISSGIVKEPHFVLIYGPPGIGKTSFAAGAPKSIITGPERGSNQINTARFDDIKTYADTLKSIKWLRNEKHDFQSVGVDSLDTIEPLLWADVAKADGKKDIESVGGGFQKGYVFALDHWRQFIEELQDLRRNRNMNIICIAHSQIKTMNDPTQMLPYDRFTMKLHENKQCSAIALWMAAVDTVLFANTEDTVFKDRDKKVKTLNEEGVRKVYTRRRAAYDAKNRLGLPSDLPLDYSAFSNAADLGQPNSIEMIREELADVATQIKNADVLTKMQAAIERAGSDAAALAKILNHARTLAGEAA